MFMINELLIKELSEQVGINTSDIQDIKDAEVYSINEVKTNKIWIDGKPIYSKVIKDINVTSNMSEIISTGLSNVNIINIYGEYHTTDYDVVQTIPYISPSKEYVIEIISMNKGENIRYRTASGFNGKSNIVLEYTKTTD